MDGRVCIYVYRYNAFSLGFFFSNKHINTSNLAALINRMHADFLCCMALLQNWFTFDNELQVWVFDEHILAVFAQYCIEFWFVYAIMQLCMAFYAKILFHFNSN